MHINVGHARVEEQPMTTIDVGPRPDIVPKGEVCAAIVLAIPVVGRAANALILGLVAREIRWFAAAAARRFEAKLRYLVWAVFPSRSA